MSATDSALAGPDDPRLAPFIGLNDRALRLSRPPAFVAESDLVVSRAIDAGYELRSVVIDGQRTAELPFALPERATLLRANPTAMEAMTGRTRHDGCLGLFARGDEPDPAAVLDGATRVLAVERVTNPINLGIVARTAAALGIDALIVDYDSVDPLYRRVSRIAMGECFRLPWARLPQGKPVVEALKASGFETWALTPDAGATPIDAVASAARVALVLGAEGPGLSEHAKDSADKRVRIPLADGVDSLNVAAAAAIACWAIRPTT